MTRPSYQEGLEFVSVDFSGGLVWDTLQDADDGGLHGTVRKCLFQLSCRKTHGVVTHLLG